MRGIPDFNFPAFDDAAKKLRALGHEVFNPAEHDRRTYGDTLHSSTGDLGDIPQFDLREALLADLTWILTQAEGIVVLPGWQSSKGANAEVATANAVGLPIFVLPGSELIPLGI